MMIAVMEKKKMKMLKWTKLLDKEKRYNINKSLYNTFVLNNINGVSMYKVKCDT